MATRATRSPRRRTVVALAVVLAVLAGFMVRLVDIQVVNADEHIADSLEHALGGSQTLYGTRGSIVDASGQLAQSLAQNASLGRVVQDVKAARDRLVYPGFLARTPCERLEHLPRYLKGYALRLQKYRAGAERDQKHAATVHDLWERYAVRAKADQDAGRDDPSLEEFRWLIEELRVSLFAQELKTPVPISVKRLARLWQTVRR